MYNTSGTSHGQRNGDERASSTTSSSTRTAGDDGLTPEEQKTLDRVADALARLGRAKRVGLTIQDKKNFVEAWMKTRK